MRLFFTYSCSYLYLKTNSWLSSTFAVDKVLSELWQKALIIGFFKTVKQTQMTKTFKEKKKKLKSISIQVSLNTILKIYLVRPITWYIPG